MLKYLLYDKAHDIQTVICDTIGTETFNRVIDDLQSAHISFDGDNFCIAGPSELEITQILMFLEGALFHDNLLIIHLVEGIADPDFFR